MHSLITNITTSHSTRHAVVFTPKLLSCTSCRFWYNPSDPFHKLDTRLQCGVGRFSSFNINHWTKSTEWISLQKSLQNDSSLLSVLRPSSVHKHTSLTNNAILFTRWSNQSHVEQAAISPQRKIYQQSVNMKWSHPSDDIHQALVPSGELTFYMLYSAGNVHHSG